MKILVKVTISEIKEAGAWEAFENEMLEKSQGRWEYHQENLNDVYTFTLKEASDLGLIDPKLTCIQLVGKR